MALGRQILKPARIVLVHDSALPDDFDYVAYAEAHYDASMLTEFKPGEKPTWFTVKQLKHRQLAARDGAGAGFDKNEFTVRCGLVSVEGWKVYDSNDDEQPVDEIERKSTGKLGELVTEKWLEHADFGELTLSVIASAIERLSFPEIPLSKRSVTAVGVTESSPAEAKATKK